MAISYSKKLTNLLGKHMDTKCIISMVFPEFNLGQNLICERITHDKTWMTVSTSQVNQTSFGQQNNMATIWKCVSINLKSEIEILLSLVSQVYTKLVNFHKYFEDLLYCDNYDAKFSTCGLTVSRLQLALSQAASISQSK